MGDREILAGQLLLPRCTRGQSTASQLGTVEF